MYNGIKGDMALIMTTLSMLAFAEAERTETEFGISRDLVREKDRSEHKIAALKKHCRNLDGRYEELTEEDAADRLAQLVHGASDLTPH